MSSKLAAIALLLLLSWFAYKVVRPTLGQMTYGFIGYYTASYLLSQGQFGPQVYDDLWFSQQVNELVTQDIGEILTPTVPAVAWLTLPLAWLPPQTARNAWIWLNGLFLAVVLIVLPSIRPDPWRSPQLKGTCLLLGLGLLCPAVAANFRLGQGFIFFMMLYVLVLVGVLSGRDAPAGAVLGLALALKTVGLFLWLLPLLQKRWRMLASGIGIILAVGLLGLPWIHVDVWQAYGQAVVNFSSSASIAYTPYQTTAGFFTHLFRFDAIWNPAPLLNLPWLATGLTLLVTTGSLLITIWLGRKAPAGLLFAALVPLSTILLPKAEEHHFVFLLIPIAVLIAHHEKSDTMPHLLEQLLFIAAIALLMIPIPYWHPFFSSGWMALLAYPRLYSGWLFWLAVITQMAKG